MANPKGRPLKLKPTVLQAILKAIRDGASDRDAAEMAGISPKTLEKHLHNNPAIMVKVAEARATRSIMDVAILTKAAKGGQWEALAYQLDKRTEERITLEKGPNQVAAEATVDALTLAKRIHPEHAALVTSLLSIAEAIDRDPDNASMYRQYLQVEEALRQKPTEEPKDEITELLTRLRTPLGNAQDAAPQDTGTRSRKDRAGTRSASHAVAAKNSRRSARG